MERLVPILEGLYRQERQTGSHKCCLPLTKRRERLAMYPYTLSDFGKNE